MDQKNKHMVCQSELKEYLKERLAKKTILFTGPCDNKTANYTNSILSKNENFQKCCRLKRNVSGKEIKEKHRGKKMGEKVWRVGDKELFAKHKKNKRYEVETCLLTKSLKRKLK